MRKKQPDAINFMRTLLVAKIFFFLKKMGFKGSIHFSPASKKNYLQICGNTYMSDDTR